MRAQKEALWIGVCMLALATPTAQAQQSQQSQQQAPQQPADQSSGPIPAYRSPLASAADNDNADDESQQELTPDTRSLSGAQDLSLGNPAARNYWQPHLEFSEMADSNAQETENSVGWGTWTSLSGGVDVHQTSRSNDLSLSYTSGAMLAQNLGVSSGVVQELHFTDKFTFRRSSLSFLDELNYLPESALGYGGLTLPAVPGGISPGLGSSFTPNQSLLTGYGQNLGNAFATELNTFLTPRTSLTFVGGYSLLHFFDSDLLDFTGFNFRGGYNYQMTRKDAIALLYTFNGTRFSNFNQFINVHTVQASYGRRVTGRLAFQAAAGPQIVTSRIPISANAASGDGTGTGTNLTEVFWSLNTALAWRAERTSLGLSYNHGATGGSGVLAGAITDVVTGGASRQVSRTFSNSFSAGYSRNEGVSLSSSKSLSTTYNYVFARAGLSHPFGQATALDFSYQIQYQTSNSALCIGTACGTDVIRHMISLGVSWKERPLTF